MGKWGKRDDVDPGDRVKVLTRAGGRDVPDQATGIVQEPGFHRADQPRNRPEVASIEVVLDDGEVIAATSWKKLH